MKKLNDIEFIALGKLIDMDSKNRERALSLNLYRVSQETIKQAIAGLRWTYAPTKSLLYRDKIKVNFRALFLPYVDRVEKLRTRINYVWVNNTSIYFDEKYTIYLPLEYENIGEVIHSEEHLTPLSFQLNNWQSIIAKQKEITQRLRGL